MAEKKYCPFGFFSFFINKQASQAGGCHHCLESACAFWEEMEDENGRPVEGQCAILSISDSLKMMAAGSASAVMPREESIVDTILSTSSSPPLSSPPPPPPPLPSLMDLFNRAKSPGPVQNHQTPPSPPPISQNQNLAPLIPPQNPPSVTESSVIESLGIK